MAQRLRDRVEVGEEPDPRFTLANERTFLAWSRTALALIGGGVAVGQLLDFSSVAARLTCALAPILLGAVLAVAGLRRWVGVQAALRAGRPLPPAQTAPILAIGIAILAVAVTVALIVDAIVD